MYSLSFLKIQTSITVFYVERVETYISFNLQKIGVNNYFLSIILYISKVGIYTVRKLTMTGSVDVLNNTLGRELTVLSFIFLSPDYCIGVQKFEIIAELITITFTYIQFIYY